MRLDDYYKSLSIPERDAFAKRIGTSANYLNNHYFRAQKKMPRQARLREIALATGGAVSFAEVVEHFIPIEHSNAAVLTNPHGEESSETERKTNLARA